MHKLYHILNVIGEAIHRFVSAIGRVTAWCSMALVFITCIVVVLRYGFGIGAIALQELALYLFAALFMLGAAITLARDAHVRVDVLYRHFNTSQRAWVNIAGCLFFLVPTALSMVLLSWDFVVQAWINKEGSIESDGLPYVYVLKTLIPLCGGLLLFQGLANLIENTLVLAGFHPRQQSSPQDEVTR